MPGDLTSLLKQAVALQQQGQYAEAQALYRQVLVLDPLHFDALHLNGVAERQRGHPEQALVLIRAALDLQPDSASARCNVGAVLQDLGRHQEALDSFDRALAVQPGYSMALYNRGNALRHLARLDEALASYDRALALKPDYPEALCNRALALLGLQRPAEAIDSCQRALRLRARYADAWNVRGSALLALGDAAAALDSFDEALHSDIRHGEAWRQRAALLLRLGELDDAIDSAERACACRPGDAQSTLGRANILRAMEKKAEAAAAYRQAREEGADPALVDYMLALLGEGTAPAVAPPSYVAALFDQYAGHFDQHLQGVLGYRTPALLELALGPAHGLHVIDLGCGTGLCGPWLRRIARTLEGVDLSAAMLAQARETGCYDGLRCAELTQYLHGHVPVDLLVAADVLVYFGDLDGVIDAMRCALRPGGRVAFSVEESTAAGFQLNAGGRYAHSESYVRSVAASHGVEVTHLSRAVIRKDGRREVGGLIVVLERPAAQ